MKNYPCWEEEVSEYLKRVVQNPENEVEICEELILFIMDIAQDEFVKGIAWVYNKENK